MHLDPFLCINHIVLVYSRVLLLPPYSPLGLPDEIKKHIPYLVLLRESFICIVTTDVMIIPNTNNWCLILEKCIDWVIDSEIKTRLYVGKVH